MPLTVPATMSTGGATMGFPIPRLCSGQSFSGMVQGLCGTAGIGYSRLLRPPDRPEVQAPAQETGQEAGLAAAVPVVLGVRGTAAPEAEEPLVDAHQAVGVPADLEVRLGAAGAAAPLEGVEAEALLEEAGVEDSAEGVPVDLEAVPEAEALGADADGCIIALEGFFFPGLFFLDIPFHSFA